MTGRLEGRTAFITGAGRGMGRSHALRLASEGADIIAVDICAPIASVPYPLSSPDDLAETARQVKALGRGIHAVEADVRDHQALRDVVTDGVRAVGPIDIVVANAGIATFVSESPDDPSSFSDTIDVNLTGVWNTVKAAAPLMLERGEGGSIILISSNLGLSGRGGDGTEAYTGYVASKHGVVGVMRATTHWLSPHGIRVNSVHPTATSTPMIENDWTSEWFGRNPGASALHANLMPVDTISASDISDAVLWLASDESAFVTGSTIQVDAGFVAK
jgi:SDR family mycofactocin-dependent oxidoreductase